MVQANHWVLGPAGANSLIDYTMSEEQHDNRHVATQITSNTSGFANDHPHTSLVYPVYRDKDPSHPSGSDVDSPMVAMIVNEIPWDTYLQNLLPEGVNGIDCVLHNSAGQAFTYHIRGPDAIYLGPEDLHEPEFDNREVQIDTFDDFFGETGGGASLGHNPGNLHYWFSIYPSEELRRSYDTLAPITMAVGIVVIFTCMIVAFVLYDRFVSDKNNLILDAATNSNAILASLFPEKVKDRLLQDQVDEGRVFEQPSESKGLLDFFESDTHTQVEIPASKPIADVFERATVLFADIVGFTAWSSIREPSDVFVLLETLYASFDSIAKSLNIETIGDCYVAVTGCPIPCDDHHIAMCKFAAESMKKMKKLCRKLESELGPDTSTLNMRSGLHSGPVTGGVLRGERSRFQLFGDTMNTAARMESNGKPGKIHLSGATAELLIASGKRHWVEKREDKIHAKGKGELQTFFLREMAKRVRTSSYGSRQSGNFVSAEESAPSQPEGEALNESVAEKDSLRQLDQKTCRMVDWTTHSLLQLLERLVSMRETQELSDGNDDSPPLPPNACGTPLEELQDMVSFQPIPINTNATTDIILDRRVHDQLKEFVGAIASIYPSNDFHNFERASHVMLAVSQFFYRMASHTSTKPSVATGELSLLDISADPLAVFACSFAVLIRDIKHPGIPNSILQAENPSLASMYKDRSIAEQHSFSVAWDLLLTERFDDLRQSIFSKQAEQARFRQLVITAIMATDLLDQELWDSRVIRWGVAFETGFSGEQGELDRRRATLVLELLVQAADMFHCLQHWDLYLQWNTHLYQETYRAFVEERTERDPAEYWFDGELTIFDYHVIPLVRKLCDLGCLGVYGEECLQNATQNRQEWAERGVEIIKDISRTVLPPVADDASESMTSFPMLWDTDSDGDGDSDSSEDQRNAEQLDFQT